MPNAQNKEMLASIKEDLDGVSAMWVVDYRGLTVKEMQQMPVFLYQGYKACKSKGDAAKGMEGN